MNIGLDSVTWLQANLQYFYIVIMESGGAQTSAH